MTSFIDAVSHMDTALFNEFSEPAILTRQNQEPEQDPVSIIIDRGTEWVGDNGQVISNAVVISISSASPVLSRGDSLQTTTHSFQVSHTSSDLNGIRSYVVNETSL